MKIEIGESGPDNLKEYWPGQHSVFHRLEYACGIPSVLFAITTRKENGRPNVNFHGWSSFTGDVGGFYAVLPGVQHTSHTYQNVLRTGEFVINFLGKQHYDACIATVSANGGDTDEIAAGGLTEETAAVVDCPRLREAFLSLECRAGTGHPAIGKRALLASHRQGGPRRGRRGVRGRPGREIRGRGVYALRPCAEKPENRGGKTERGGGLPCRADQRGGVNG